MIDLTHEMGSCRCSILVNNDDVISAHGCFYLIIPWTLIVCLIERTCASTLLSKDELELRESIIMTAESNVL